MYDLGIETTSITFGKGTDHFGKTGGKPVTGIVNKPKLNTKLFGGNNGNTINFSSKAEARQAYTGEIGKTANKFFKDATGKSQNFKAIENKDKITFEFFSPANNPGYGKKYVMEVNYLGERIREFKDTMGPNGLIERKWVYGGN